MILYVIAALIGLVIGLLLAEDIVVRKPSQFEENLYQQLRAGNDVTVFVNDYGYLFQMKDGKITLKHGKIPSASEMKDVSPVDDLGAVQSSSDGNNVEEPVSRKQIS